MTKDNPVKQIFKDLSHKDTQQQQQQQQQKKPFEIVLVDIAKAKKGEIHCVKMPLEGNEEDLKYVTLSYRWGELQETLIDTKLGYTASITSFDLKDFYNVCDRMTMDSDFKHIKYVWVDAICVDQRPSKRKATIYQMSNIYERAAYVLAVPDLHSAYLRHTSIKNNEIMKGSLRYCQEIYHLIHGNTDQLAAADEEFLNDAYVPTDPVLRQLLKKYTDYFTDGFMKFKRHHYGYCSMQAFLHICEITGQSTVYPTTHPQTQVMTEETKRDAIEDSHHCREMVCPLPLFDYTHESGPQKVWQLMDSNWKTRIIERNTSIRQSMEFLADLIKDWSTRVWVISEFNIAKKKNNFRFWFTQLHGLGRFNDNFNFFTFDFEDDNLALPSVIDNIDIYAIDEIDETRYRTSNPVYIEFHSMMVHQLHQQTFLAMMLKSKASRNEDRFYAVLPQSEYKNILSDRNKVNQWNITTLTSIKLKLYEFMNTKDKLNLLFWSGNEISSNKGMLLPTFATSTLSSDAPSDYLHYDSVDAPSNFDLTDPSAIVLHHYQVNNKNSKDSDDGDDDDDDDDLRQLYYLRLKPMEYYIYTDSVINVRHEHGGLRRSMIQWKNLLMDKINPNNNISATAAGAATTTTNTTTTTTTTDLDIVAIRTARYDVKGSYGILPCIVLVGSFAENKWSLQSENEEFGRVLDERWKHCYINENNHRCFDIY